MPGAANETMVNARTSPSVATSAPWRTRCRSTTAQALRRSKNRAPHAGALVRDQVRLVAQHQVVDERDLVGHVVPPVCVRLLR